VHVGDAVLDVFPTGIKVWHWDSVHGSSTDYASCHARLAAFWALARWAVLDGTALSDAQQKLVRGPTLGEAARLDADIAVEGAADAFKKAVPSGWCRTENGLACVADIDDVRVRELRFQWANALHSRVRGLRMQLASAAPDAERNLAACLEPVLGKAEETVVDYARGTRSFSWSLDDAGSKAILQSGTFTFATSEKHPVDQKAPWSARIADFAAAVERCKP
jgi:hypothetical protein